MKTPLLGFKFKPHKKAKITKRDKGMIQTLMKRHGIDRGEATTMHIRSGL